METSIEFEEICNTVMKDIKKSSFYNPKKKIQFVQFSNLDKVRNLLNTDFTNLFV